MEKLYGVFGAVPAHPDRLYRSGEKTPGGIPETAEPFHRKNAAEQADRGLRRDREILPVAAVG